MRNAAEQSAARQYTNFLEYIERAAQKLSLKGAIFYRPTHFQLNFRRIQINGNSD